MLANGDEGSGADLADDAIAGNLFVDRTDEGIAALIYSRPSTHEDFFRLGSRGLEGLAASNDDVS